MANKSRIILRGIEGQLECSEKEARTIQALLDDKTKGGECSITLERGNKRKTFRKSDIKFIDCNPDFDTKEQFDKNAVEFYKDEARRFNLTSSQSPETKAKGKELFDFLYNCATGKKPTDYGNLYSIQLDFFKQNPRRTLCDLHLLTPMIPFDPSKLGHFHEGGLRLCERVVFRDMQLSGQLRSSVQVGSVVSGDTISEMKMARDDNRQNDKDFDEFVKTAVSTF